MLFLSGVPNKREEGREKKKEERRKKEEGRGKNFLPPLSKQFKIKQ
jgi:hypothetical protein